MRVDDPPLHVLPLAVRICRRRRRSPPAVLIFLVWSKTVLRHDLLTTVLALIRSAAGARIVHIFENDILLLAKRRADAKLARI